MTALATSTDVEAALGRTLTAEQETRADGLLEIASQAVLDFTGYHFESGTIGRQVRGPRFRIPATVATVTSVTAVDQCDGSTEAVTDYTLRGSTLYGLPCAWLEIAFTVTADVPADVVSIVAGMVATTLDSPAANVASESAGAFSRSFVSSSGRVYMSASDKAALRRFKQPKPAIRLVADVL